MQLPPRMSKPPVLHEAITAADAVTGDIDDELAATISAVGAMVASAGQFTVTDLPSVNGAISASKRAPPSVTIW